MRDQMASMQVGDVVRIGKGKTQWTIERHRTDSYPEVDVHLFDLRAVSNGRMRFLNLRSDMPILTLLWTLEEVVLGADALTA